MPELPEVELVAHGLREHVVGRTIVAAAIHRAGLVVGRTPADFARALTGAQVTAVARRGKHILVALDRPLVWLVHLRMAGRFLLLPPERALPPHAHGVFTLEDGRRLVYVDPRHFGVMRLVPAEALAATPELRGLGPEPLAPDFDPARLRVALAGSRRSVKDLLLDQTRIAGLGNIYAAEALFRARIKPTVVGATLSPARLARLHAAIVSVLRESLAHGSTLAVDPVRLDAPYYSGGFGGRFAVYDREGEPCPTCGAAIRRLAQAGRSTYYCPRCQAR